MLPYFFIVSTAEVAGNGISEAERRGDLQLRGGEEEMKAILMLVNLLMVSALFGIWAREFVAGLFIWFLGSFIISVIKLEE